MIGKAVRAMQALQSRDHSGPIQNASEVVIRSPAGLFYCVKNTVNIGQANRNSDLQCFTAGVPYIFGYDGPSNREQEALSILSTFK